MHEKKVTDEWPILIVTMRYAMARRLSPRHPIAQKLARQWMGLLRRTAIEEPELLHNYDGTQRFEPGVVSAEGIDVEMLDYLSSALWAKHLTPEETNRLRSNGPKQREWPRLLAALREEMNRGTSVVHPVVQRLYREWESII